MSSCARSAGCSIKLGILIGNSWLIAYAALVCEWLCVSVCVCVSCCSGPRAQAFKHTYTHTKR